MLINASFGVIFAGIVLFPVMYAACSKLGHKVLFLAACYGVEQIITVLLLGLASPVILLSIFAFPQLEANGSLKGIRWLLVAMRFVQDYWYFGTPIILLITPFVIKMRYQDVFVVQRKT